MNRYKITYEDCFGKLRKPAFLVEADMFSALRVFEINEPGGSNILWCIKINMFDCSECIHKDQDRPNWWCRYVEKGTPDECDAFVEKIKPDKPKSDPDELELLKDIQSLSKICVNGYMASLIANDGIQKNLAIKALKHACSELLEKS